MTKKILSLILALIICFTSMLMAFAEESTTVPEETTTGIEETTTTVPEESTTEYIPEESTTEYIPEEETTLPEETTTTQPVEPTEPAVPDVPVEPTEPVYDENEIVAKFYVFLVETTVHPMGHTWVYVENLTDRELQVGLYTLPPYEGVSVGVLARKDGWGIYYNVESYAQNVHGMTKQISMSENLTVKKLEKVSKTIVNYVNHWDPFFNCMYFAFKVWNSGSYRILLPLLLPIFGKLQMAIYRHERNVQMKPVTKEQTFRQVGFGKRAYLVRATDQVLGVV